MGIEWILNFALEFTVVIIYADNKGPVKPNKKVPRLISLGR